jgi:hypothetical protein
MSEINYYLRNWGKIYVWLVVYCIAELIFGSFTFIFKAILFIILMINNRKFLYLLSDQEEQFKKYFRSLQTACIFLIIGSIIQLANGLVFSLPSSYYYYAYYGYYGLPDWYLWVYSHEDAIKLSFIIVENGLVVGIMIAEGTAWARLRLAFERNLLDTKSYHHDNFLRATKIMLAGAILLAIVYFATTIYQGGFLLFGERYYYSTYPIIWGVDYDYPLTYRYGTGYTITYWIVRSAGSIALILLAIGYGTMGSNLKNPFLMSKGEVVGHPARPNPMFGRHFNEKNNVPDDRMNYDLNFCPKCGAKIRPDARFCQVCGLDINKFHNT